MKEKIINAVKSAAIAIVKVVSAIWQLPQNIIGLLFLAWYYDFELVERRGDVWIVKSKRMKGGISLGQFIILSKRCAENKDTINHEYGHTRQSLLLGWLYLFVIGIPSLVWAGLCSYSAKYENADYYSFYTERWADKWGGVKR